MCEVVNIHILIVYVFMTAKKGNVESCMRWMDGWVDGWIDEWMDGWIVR